MEHLHINNSQFISRPGKPNAPFLECGRGKVIGEIVWNTGEKEIKVRKECRNG
jgi:hypothetical protein